MPASLHQPCYACRSIRTAKASTTPPARALTHPPRSSLASLSVGLHPTRWQLVIGFYQIATKIEEVYEVESPPEVRRISQTFSYLVSFGIAGFDSVLECLDMRGYQSTLSLYIVVPILLAILILVIAAGWQLWASVNATRTAMRKDVCKDGSEEEPTSSPRGFVNAFFDQIRNPQNYGARLESAASALLLLAFITYPLVATKAFEAFSCYQFEESQWLKADVTIQCSSASYASPAHEEATGVPPPLD